MCTKNGVTRFSLLYNSFFCHDGHFGLGGGGLGVLGEPPPPWFLIILKTPWPLKKQTGSTMGSLKRGTGTQGGTKGAHGRPRHGGALGHREYGGCTRHAHGALGPYQVLAMGSDWQTSGTGDRHWGLRAARGEGGQEAHGGGTTDKGHAYNRPKSAPRGHTGDALEAHQGALGASWRSHEASRPPTPTDKCSVSQIHVVAQTREQGIEFFELQAKCRHRGPPATPAAWEDVLPTWP